MGNFILPGPQNGPEQKNKQQLIQLPSKIKTIVNPKEGLKKVIQPFIRGLTLRTPTKIPGQLPGPLGTIELARQQFVDPIAKSFLRAAAQIQNFARAHEGRKPIEYVGSIPIPKPTIKQTGGDILSLAMLGIAPEAIKGLGFVAGVPGRILGAGLTGAAFNAAATAGEGKKVTPKTLAGGYFVGTALGAGGEAIAGLGSKLNKYINTPLVKTTPTPTTRTGVTPTEPPLLTEARKYKSAEEFVKANDLLYHGTNKQTAAAIKKAGGFTPETARISTDLFGGKVSSKAPVSLTMDEATGKLYAGPRPEGGTGELLTFSGKALKIADTSVANKLQYKNGQPISHDQFISKLKQAGYDGYHTSSPMDEMAETVVFNKDKLKLSQYSKSQLTDIWEEANRGTPSKAQIKTPGAETLSGLTRRKRPTLKTIQDVTSSAIENITSRDIALHNQGYRVFRIIADKLKLGDIQVDSVPRILEQYKLSPEQFAKMFLEEISLGAKKMNALSQYGKQFAKLLEKTDPTAAALFDRVEPPKGIYTTIANIYRKVDNFRRAMMVGQIATAMRNLISQGARYGLQVFDDTFAGIGETLTGKQAPAKAFAPAIEDVMAFGRRLTKSGRIRLNEMLDKFPDAEAELLGAPIQDISLGTKTARVVNYLNRTQEYLFRKMRFDAVISSELKRLNVKSISELPKSIIEKAVKSSLEITFAERPKNGFGNAILKTYNEVPFLTALGNPFPRFWVNSMKFLWDFSPGGFTKFLLPKYRTSLMSADSRIALQALSRATAGTLMFSGAMAIRNSKFGGEKWYEINVGGKTIDTRSFAPFSTYLFLAEALSDRQALTGLDFLQGIVSINRIAGTGLVFLDLIRSDSIGKTTTKLLQFLDAYTASFLTPLATLKDFIGQISNEEVKSRDINTIPFGRTINAIPILNRVLPKSPSITRNEVFTREHPILRQLTGISIKTKNPLEREIDRLGIQFTDIAPKTGSDTLDRMIANDLGVIISKYNIVGSPFYKNLSDPAKKEYIKSVYASLKSALSQYEKRANPDEVKPNAPTLKDLLEKEIEKRPEIKKYHPIKDFILPGIQ